MSLIVVRIATTIQLNEQQKSELTSIAQSRSLPAGYVFRAKLILMLNDGVSFTGSASAWGQRIPRLFVGKSALWLAGSTCA